MVIVYLSDTQRKVITPGTKENLKSLLKRFCEENNINVDQYDFRTSANQTLDPGIIINDYKIRELRLIKIEENKVTPILPPKPNEPQPMPRTKKLPPSTGKAEKRLSKRPAPKPPVYQNMDETTDMLYTLNENSINRSLPDNQDADINIPSPPLSVPFPQQPNATLIIPNTTSVECTANEQELSFNETVSNEQFTSPSNGVNYNSHDNTLVKPKPRRSLGNVNLRESSQLNTFSIDEIETTTTTTTVSNKLKQSRNIYESYELENGKEKLNLKKDDQIDKSPRKSITNSTLTDTFQLGTFTMDGSDKLKQSRNIDESYELENELKLKPVVEKEKLNNIKEDDKIEKSAPKRHARMNSDSYFPQKSNDTFDKKLPAKNPTVMKHRYRMSEGVIPDYKNMPKIDLRSKSHDPVVYSKIKENVIQKSDTKMSDDNNNRARKSSYTADSSAQMNSSVSKDVNVNKSDKFSSNKIIRIKVSNNKVKKKEKVNDTDFSSSDNSDIEIMESKNVQASNFDIYEDRKVSIPVVPVTIKNNTIVNNDNDDANRKLKTNESSKEYELKIEDVVVKDNFSENSAEIDSIKEVIIEPVRKKRDDNESKFYNNMANLFENSQKESDMHETSRSDSYSRTSDTNIMRSKMSGTNYGVTSNLWVPERRTSTVYQFRASSPNNKYDETDSAELIKMNKSSKSIDLSTVSNDKFKINNQSEVKVDKTDEVVNVRVIEENKSQTCDVKNNAIDSFDVKKEKPMLQSTVLSENKNAPPPVKEKKKPVVIIKEASNPIQPGNMYQPRKPRTLYFTAGNS